jgi:hypothetical protein
VDAHPEAAIALWLRESRASQTMSDGQGGEKRWTVAHFLDLLQAETGWAPAHSNYSNYELGKQTPNPVTLRKFERFWAARGIDGPDLSPQDAPGATESPADLIAALAAQTAAINALVALLSGDLPERVAALEPVVSRLAERVLGEASAPRVPRGAAG